MIYNRIKSAYVVGMGMSAEHKLNIYPAVFIGKMRKEITEHLFFVAGQIKVRLIRRILGILRRVNHGYFAAAFKNNAVGMSRV